MRTTITMDSALLNELTKVCGEKAKTTAVTIAVKEYLRRNKLKKLAGMLGTIGFDESSGVDADRLDLERSAMLEDQAGKDE